MAKSQEKQAFTNCSPIMEHEQEIDSDEKEDETVSASGCGCFRLFCFERLRSGGGDGHYPLQQRGEHKETWLVKKMRKAKEVSELVAGPKWKNFIRKISKYFNKQKARTQFQYDPQSYALNFDEGVDEEEDGLLPGLPSRFSGPFSVEERRVGL